MNAPRAVLFDFTGTLFWIETAEDAVAAALGADLAALAPELRRLGAINGSGHAPDLPDHLVDAWACRDLDAVAHRAAYSGLGVHAGLTRAQADRLYDRGVAVEAWRPYPDTHAVLQRLRDAAVPTALVSNIGWDPRPVLAAHGVDGLLTTLVLSDERGVQKPDPAIFALACGEVGVDAADALMVGDNPDTDGAARDAGIRFVLVDPDPGRPPDTLLRAVGLTSTR